MTFGRVTTALAIACALGSVAEAQRGRGTPGEKPQVDVVQTFGCAERKDGSPETWWVTRATEPRPATNRVFTSTEVGAAKAAPLGTATFQLVGVADFLDTEGLLKTGRRKEFTTAENANATGDLRPGRKVLLKGLLTDANGVKRINLTALVSVADTCA